MPHIAKYYAAPPNAWKTSATARRDRCTSSPRCTARRQSLLRSRWSRATPSSAKDRGVTFGYDGKPFLRDTFGQLFKDEKWAPRAKDKGFADLLMWDAFKLDLMVSRERTRNIEFNSLGLLTENDIDLETNFKWGFKYEIDVGKLACQFDSVGCPK